MWNIAPVQLVYEKNTNLANTNKTVSELNSDKQDKSTAITTSNIVNQSVAFANRATYIGINNNNNDSITSRAYVGTPSRTGVTFLQQDFVNNCVNIGIDGLGAIGVNKARSADTASSCSGNAATSSNATNHINNESNPHNVTKEQVGLGNVDNTADSVKNVNYANLAGLASRIKANDAYQNQLGVREYVGTPANSNLTFMFAQADFNKNVVNIGINGAGAVGVNNSLHANNADYSAYLNTNIVTRTNLDKVTNSGVYKCEDTPCLILHMQYDSNYAIQLGHFYANGGVFQWRVKFAGTWSSFMNL